MRGPALDPPCRGLRLRRLDAVQTCRALPWTQPPAAPVRGGAGSARQADLGASPLVCQLNADRLPPLPPAVSKKRSGSPGSFGVDEIKTGRNPRPVFISSTAFSLPAYQCLPRTAVDLRIRTDRQTDHSHLFPSPSGPG